MQKLLQKLAELKVDKSNDRYNTIVRALQEAGFTVIEEHNGINEAHYSIALEKEE